jgi:hypothetical protein
MNTAVTIRFPRASAEKLGLDVSHDDTYRLSWIELAFRLTQASGQAELANPEVVKRALSGYWQAQAATKAALRRPDWQQMAWACGLLVLLDQPDEISPEQAGCYLECFFLAVFTQPERSRDWAARKVRPEHTAGWAYALSCVELSDLAGNCDERLDDNAYTGVCATIMASALDLYLRWTGQVIEPDLEEDLPEPDELPIPAVVTE